MSRETLNILRQCTPVFAILQDESRQEILSRLFDDGELSVNALAEKMPISRSAVSHHLKQLLQVGVVSVRREGKERFYRLTLDSSITLIRRLLHAIEEDQKILTNPE